jgi:hypothetical protein
LSRDKGEARAPFRPASLGGIYERSGRIWLRSFLTRNHTLRE